MDLNPNLDPKHLVAAELMIDNEEFQNIQYSPVMREKVLAGIDCDFLVDDLETFGKTVDNPIPVNGHYGVHTYLSRLTSKDGMGFFYHRLGSKGTVEHYEICCFGGQIRGSLYFDIYHPRRSRQAVNGLALMATPQAFTGFDRNLRSFPDDFYQELRNLDSRHKLLMAEKSELTVLLDFCFQMLGRTPDPTFSDRLVQPLPYVEDDLGGEYGFTWRDHVSESEINEAKELRGFIVKTEGEMTVMGEKFGWYPSKTLAKRRKLDPNLMYDPAVIVILEGFEIYREFAKDTDAYAMSLKPMGVWFDEQGFFSTLEFTSNHYQGGNFASFLENYYLPKRAYQVSVAWDNYTWNKGTISVRWFSDIVENYKVSYEHEPPAFAGLIARLDDVGNFKF
jgi:hypothetical protein